jgi:hypothetical protein
MDIGKPEPGLVISYAYLWHREHEAGKEEGRKDRPCVIVVCVEVQAAGTQVTVAPITHASPQANQTVIEIPLRVKQHLGLDDARSWVILDEVNQFIWPGFDLRPVPGKEEQVAYGFLPPRLFDQIRTRLLEHIVRQHGRITLRD